MTWFLFGFYFYVCFMFAIWYIRWRRSLDKPTNFKGSEWEFAAFFFTVGVSWWYWPLMILYIVEYNKAKKARELERFKAGHKV